MAKTVSISTSALEQYLNQNFVFSYNPILDRTEFKRKREKQFKLFTERDLNSIFREVKGKGISCTLSALDSLLHSDYVQEIDPFQFYFTNLPAWRKNDPDYIGQLAATVKVRNETFWKWALPKWLAAVVGNAIDKHSINQQVLVFVGKQGIGKSTWLNNLLPKQLEGYLYSGVVNPSNKDTLVNLSENLIINLDELENLNKTELGSLKSLITQSSIRLRKAYGVYNEFFTRRASFVGSVNEVEFLTDTTGNRRYLVVDCEDIDYNNTIDMDKVYSQAYALYKDKNFRHFFDKVDIKEIDENNERFVRVSLEEELLLAHYRIPLATDKEILELNTTAIAGKLQEKTKLRIGDSSSIRRLGSAMQKHEWPRVSKKNSKLYQLVALESLRLTEDVVTEPIEAEKKEKRKYVAGVDYINIPETLKIAMPMRDVLSLIYSYGKQDFDIPAMMGVINTVALFIEKGEGVEHILERTEGEIYKLKG